MHIIVTLCFDTKDITQCAGYSLSNIKLTAKNIIFFDSPPHPPLVDVETFLSESFYVHQYCSKRFSYLQQYHATL